MLPKKFDKAKPDAKAREDEIEMEEQFILRLPEPAAELLNKAIQENSSKDRFLIKLEDNMRHGEVYLDQYHYYGKILDLPTIVESMKTIDSKNFYKTADISQIMICKEEPDDDTDKESPQKGKKKDSTKVEKKYLYPHGLTPPCKNVRKRRFRKTLKKKTVDIPQIEKEVKHLLRQDSEAVRVDFEVINEELDKDDVKSELKDINEQDEYDMNESFNEENKYSRDANSQRHHNAAADSDADADDEGPGPSYPVNDNNTLTRGSIGEHDIFGGALTSSEEDDDDDEQEVKPKTHQQHQLMSQLSEDESRFSGIYHNAATAVGEKKNLEFNAAMFSDAAGAGAYHQAESMQSTVDVYSSEVAEAEIVYESKQESQPPISREQIQAKAASLRAQINELKMQQMQKTQEISTIQNATLKQRIQETLDSLESQIIEKELEINEYSDML